MSRAFDGAIDFFLRGKGTEGTNGTSLSSHLSLMSLPSLEVEIFSRHQREVRAPSRV